MAGLSLHRAEPAIVPTAGQVPVTLLGQAIQGGARLQLDGVDVALDVRSSERAEFVAPERYGHIGDAALTLTNPNGKQVTVQGLLTYSATELDFVAPRIVDLSLQIADFLNKDLNQDGYSDLIVSLYPPASGEKGSIAVLWGIDREPYFTNPEIVSESETIQYIARDNLRNRTNPSIFMLQKNKFILDSMMLHTVSYRKSDKSFRKVQSLEVGCLADNLLINDLDSDNFVDAIIKCTDGILIYWGGEGGFSGKRSTKIDLPDLPPHAISITSANLDGDRWPDLALGSYYSGRNESAVYVFQHMAPRQFKSIKAVSVTGVLTGVVPLSGPLNAPDSLAISNTIQRDDSSVITNLSILHWDLVMNRFIESAPQKLSGHAALQCSAELNGDGRQDLVVTHPGTGFLYHSADGNYIESPRYMPNDAHKVLTDDFNHDGVMDVLVLPFFDRRIFLLASETHLSHLPERPVAPEILRPSIAPAHVALVDINQDGQTDVVVGGAGESSQSVEMLIRSAGGQFVPQDVFKLDKSVSIITSILPGFLSPASGNGVAVVGYEIIGPNWKGSVQELKPTKMEGWSKELPSSVTPIRSGSYPRVALAADVNKDGIADLITANSGAFLWSVLIGKPFGGFSERVTQCMKQLRYERPTRILTGDFNEDGNLDLVILRTLGDTAIDILLGDGKGEFCPAESVVRAFWADDIALADANGDHHLDVLSVGSHGILGYYPGDGKGRFDAWIVTDTRCRSKAITVGDLNGDHLDDIVFDCNGADTGPRLDILRGDGHGGFGGRLSIPVEQCLSESITPQLFIHDLDGDGRPELLFNQCGQSLTVFRNRSR